MADLDGQAGHVGAGSDGATVTDLLKTLDPATLKKQIDAAVATLSKGDHGAVLFKVNQEGLSVAVVGQTLGGHLKGMVKVVKPQGAKWGWEAGGAISFAVHQDDSVQLGYDALVLFFRSRGNSAIQSRIKAAGYLVGLKPFISPDDSFYWE